jgi:hypothetical protein
VTTDAEIRAFLWDRGRRAPSPSASDFNEQILNLLHQSGSLSAFAVAETTHKDINEANGRLNALTRLGLLHVGKDASGSTIYSLSPTGSRARGLTYLSIRQA